MCMHTFKMPTIGQVQQLIQQVDYAVCIDLKDVYIHTYIVKQHCHFYILFGQINLISGRFCYLGWLHLL